MPTPTEATTQAPAFQDTAANITFPNTPATASPVAPTNYPPGQYPATTMFATDKPIAYHCNGAQLFQQATVVHDTDANLNNLALYPAASYPGALLVANDGRHVYTFNGAGTRVTFTVT